MPTVSVNTHFPGYEIIGELGRSNARVLKARHLATGDLVAIKHFTVNTDADTLRRFRLESQLMTDIQHPNVVRVREVQLDMPMPFIVMEWVEGGNLRTLLGEQGYLDVSNTIRLGLQMAEAFKAIHTRDIIHRDIKPENILFRPLPSGELHFLLTDFGVARLREQSQTMTGQSLMTYEYASPEQFDNPRGVDEATDYYSLGVVLYECLSGRVPFSMSDSAGIATFMGHVLRTQPPALLLPSGQYVPPSLDEILESTLVKNPSERLRDANELIFLLRQANLEQLQTNRPAERQVRTSSRTMAAPVQMRQPVTPAVPIPDYEPERRSNGWAIGLAFFIVTLLIGLAILYKNYQDKANHKKAQIVADSTLTVPDSAYTDTMAEDTTEASSGYLIENPTDSTATESIPESVPEPPASTSSVSDSSKAVVDSTKSSN
ncbi:serine/threonine protein kinase [Spirosoma sp. BT702]|uniref:Serine/threonine protein kinase n=1 Tax=Spirosoma profusum TaxID=2771354 RepID=A0A927ASH8_9BACT|nr:serine/threonine-protein kinase [Spirosoma profusum]MBD2703873.1 serine/threonine protein kinase [Spirosoma profusum]